MHVIGRSHRRWLLPKYLGVAALVVAVMLMAALAMVQAKPTRLHAQGSLHPQTAKPFRPSRILAGDTNLPRRDRTPLRGLLAVSLQPRVTGDGGAKRLLVDLVFKNVSNMRVKIGEWLALSTCQIRSKSLHVRDVDGNAMNLRYRTIDHGDEEVLGSGESLKVVGLDVTEAFEFPQTLQPLWMSLDTIAWVDEPRAVEVESSKAQFTFASKGAPRPGLPREGHVVKREKHDGETIVTCGM
jgi:hypothetical protein